MKKYLVIIKDNYIINRVVWDGISKWDYDFPYDLILEDVNNNLYIGDYYNEIESFFYRPSVESPNILELINK